MVFILLFPIYTSWTNLLSFNRFQSSFLGVRLNVEVCEEREEENTQGKDEEASLCWIAAAGEQWDAGVDGEGHELEKLHL